MHIFRQLLIVLIMHLMSHKLYINQICFSEQVWRAGETVAVNLRIRGSDDDLSLDPD